VIRRAVSLLLVILACSIGVAAGGVVNRYSEELSNALWPVVAVLSLAAVLVWGVLIGIAARPEPRGRRGR